MFGIFVEWVGAALILCAAIYCAYRAWVRFSWAGKRLESDIRKTVIEQGAEIRCPIHGKFPAAQLVRADDEHLVCPECYKLYVEIPTFTIHDIPNHETKK